MNINKQSFQNTRKKSKEDMRKERLKIESRINKLKKQVFLNYFFNNINKSKIYKSECWLF